jgi:AAA ATPase containing von Willebrand factor type A (vWA) domain
MPRSTRGSSAPLLSLSEGLNERTLRAAAARALQQEEPLAAAADQVDQVNVGGVVFNAFANAAAAAAAAAAAGAAEGDAAAGDDEAMDDGASAALGDTEEQHSPVEAGGDDVFALPADDDAVEDEDGEEGEEEGEEEDEDDDEARIDEAAVDGENARDEDAREHNLAEAAVEEEPEAVVLPARAVPAARNPAPRVHLVPAVGGRGKVAPGVPFRRRKVLS